MSINPFINVGSIYGIQPAPQFISSIYEQRVAARLSSLETIITKGKYPCYAKEVEALRQARMDARLEWRRKRADTMAKNKVIKAAWMYAGFVAILGGIVLASELIKLTIWTVLG